MNRWFATVGALSPGLSDYHAREAREKQARLPHLHKSLHRARPAAPPAVTPQHAIAAYLIGESTSGDPALEKAVDETRHAFAPMAEFYEKSWYPTHIGTGYPEIPRTLSIVSQWRPFAEQARIHAAALWNLGIRPTSSEGQILAGMKQVLTTRSVPGFSRHHWGSDVDVISVDSQSWAPGAALAPVAAFMHEEAPGFGFYTPYRTGHFPEPTRPHYQDEPWHLSYYPIGAPLRVMWLDRYGSGPGLSALLDHVATTLAGPMGIPSDKLRRVLDSMDLPSYQRNVSAAERRASYKG